VWKNVWSALKDAAWEAPLPVIVIGGIYGGIFTATEAAAVTAFYVLVIEVFIHHEITFFGGLPQVIRESMILVGAILIMLGSAMGVTSYLIDAQVPMKLFQFISTYVSSKVVFLIILNLFILVMNMVEIFSAIIIVVPIIVPVALQYGVDPIHLGIIFLLNLEIGYMTPPLGLNLFLSSLRFERPLPQVYRTVLPFFALLVSVLLLITYFPGLSLALTGAVR
jgi:tripartite ATP-independent transporter DctM subunit